MLSKGIFSHQGQDYYEQAVLAHPQLSAAIGLTDLNLLPQHRLHPDDLSRFLGSYIDGSDPQGWLLYTNQNQPRSFVRFRSGAALHFTGYKKQNYEALLLSHVGVSANSQVVYCDGFYRDPWAATSVCVAWAHRRLQVVAAHHDAMEIVWHIPYYRTRLAFDEFDLPLAKALKSLGYYCWGVERTRLMGYSQNMLRFSYLRHERSRYEQGGHILRPKSRKNFQ